MIPNTKIRTTSDQPVQPTVELNDSPEDWTPRRINDELNRYIVGQDQAKRSMAIAIRNRWRRQQLADDIRDEVLPKNILMIGSTGVGKTEIARRVSKFLDAPFVKVEASNFTEVGYVGRDVESIVRDLVETSISQMHQLRLQSVQEQAEYSANQRLADMMATQRERQRETANVTGSGKDSEKDDTPDEKRRLEANRKRRHSRHRNRFLAMLDNQEIEDEIIELEPEVELEAIHPHLNLLTLDNEDDLQDSLDDLVDHFETRKKPRRVKVREARTILAQQEANKLIDFDAIVESAIDRAQQSGIVFIDEIDKTISQGSDYGPDVSGEGVQRDLLPIVEGCVVMTRYGPVKTDHILFIAAGAFHNASPSNLIPELQGRFPVRVELNSLSEDDLYAILTEPENALTRQYAELLKTEDVTVEFTEDGLREIARYAALMNARTDDIGARRLHTLVERVLEELSFDAPDRAGETITVDATMVRERLGDVVLDEDTSKFIL